MANIYPPIIDNSVRAFVWDFNSAASQSFKIYFAFQGNSDKISKYILVSLQYQGRTLFKTGSLYEPFMVEPDKKSLGIAKNRYYFTIYDYMLAEPLIPNSEIVIRLVALSENIADEKDIGLNTWYNIESRAIQNKWETASNWEPWQENEKALFEKYKSTPSAMVAFSPIYQPKFQTYGALSYDYIKTKNSLYEADAENLLLKEEVPADRTEVRDGHMVTPSVTYYFKSVLTFDNAEKEKDYLEGYQITLEQVQNKNETMQIDGEGTGYPVYLLVETTGGIEYVDPYWDPARRSFRHGFQHDFTDNISEYLLTISYYTNKGYRDTVVYSLFNAGATSDANSTLPLSEVIFFNNSIEAMRSPEKGSITISCNLEAETNTVLNGRLIISRAELSSYKNDDPSSFSSLQFKTCYSEKKNIIWTQSDKSYMASFVIEDLFAEPGKLYIYKANFYYPDSSPTNQVLTREKLSPITDKGVVLMLEDIFLSTREATLKIRYNPDLTSFKRNVVDVITPTLGGAYPFIRRNGAQKYHSFNIGGLISYNAELCELNEHYEIFAYNPPNSFSEEHRQVIQGADSLGTRTLASQASDNIFAGSLFIKPELINSTDYNTWVEKGLISKEELRIIYEKAFRDLVMNFLYNDQILLFKSQSEGVRFIRLSNVNFTPNKQLDRHIYSFTATATEVLEPTLQNFLNLFMEAEATSLDDGYVDLYLLAGAYQQDPTSQQLYIGEFADGGPVDATDNDNNSMLENVWTWNKDEYNWETIVLGDKNIYQGQANIATYDTWGVETSANGELPVIIPDNETTPIEYTPEQIELLEFDLLMRE